MPDYFYDSSALAKNYHREVGTPQVTGLLRKRKANHFIARLTVIEVQSVLASKVRNGVIEFSDYQQARKKFLTDVARRRLQVIRITGNHYQETEQLIHRYAPTRSLRTLDALQLDGEGAVHELTAEQVRQLDAGSWKGPEFAGEKVPTLAEALETVKGRGLLVIEIKATGMEAEVVRAVREAEALGQCVVFSFHYDVVQKIAELEPRLPAIWLLGQLPAEETEQQALLLRALDARCAALAPHHGALTAEFIRRARRLGLGIWAWTVDDPEALRRVAALGVDALITNWPDRAVAHSLSFPCGRRTPVPDGEAVIHPLKRKEETV